MAPSALGALFMAGAVTATRYLLAPFVSGPWALAALIGTGAIAYAAASLLLNAQGVREIRDLAGGLLVPAPARAVDSAGTR
jgi:hypothetical protein